MPRRERHRLERHLGTQKPTANRVYKPIAWDIAKACLANQGGSTGGINAALRSCIVFASHAANQSCFAFQRKGDYEAAKLAHLACVNDMRDALADLSVLRFNVVAESAMKIGYLLYYLPRRLQLRRLNLSRNWPPDLTWMHWVQMAWFINYGINDVLMDPRRYLGYQRRRTQALPEAAALGPVEFWSVQQFAEYQRETIADNENIISRWHCLAELVADRNYSPGQIAKEPTGDCKRAKRNGGNPAANLALMANRSVVPRHVPGHDTI